MQPEILGLLGHLELQVLKVQPARLARSVPMGQLVLTETQGHKVYKGRQVVQGHREILDRLDCQDQQAMSDQLVLQARRDHKEHQVRWVWLEALALKDLLEALERLVLRVSPEHPDQQVIRVNLDRQDQPANPDLKDHLVHQDLLVPQDSKA